MNTELKALVDRICNALDCTYLITLQGVVFGDIDEGKVHMELCSVCQVGKCVYVKVFDTVGSTSYDSLEAAMRGLATRAEAKPGA